MSADINSSEELGIEPVAESIKVDVGNSFITDMVFEQRDDLVAWARKVARGLGFTVTIQTSDQLHRRRRPQVYLGCNRSGKYRENQLSKSQIKKGIRHSFTRRCGCPFLIKGRKEAGVDEWRVEVVCGIHNHAASTQSEGYDAFAGRLDDEEKRIVREMSQVGVKPLECLQAIKKRDPGNVTTLKTIYNARAAIRKEELCGKSPIQHFFNCLSDLGYITIHRMDEQNSNLTDLFFAHPTSIDLSMAFPSVFLLDCTYKINRFRLPLLSFVGVTSTDRTFFSAFAFLSSEKETNYIWALECFKSILNPSSLPSVLVTDRELDLISAIKNVFPTSKNLLCLSHISKNVIANCKEFFAEGTEFDKFLADWNALVRSPTESDYNSAFVKFMREFSLYPKALSYLTLTWLTHIECFVSAWTDQYFHLGNTTINRVESANAQLKRHLLVSTSNSTATLEKFEFMIYQQHADIKASFSASRIKMNQDYNDFFYSELCGVVSSFALGKIKEQRDLTESYKEDMVIDAQDCQHAIRRTLGLPCAHELVIYVRYNQPLPLSMIHDHWKRLTLVDESSKRQLYKDIDSDIEMFVTRYANANVDQQTEMKRKLCEIVTLSD